MDNFLNKTRPPVYCPGCTHEKITNGLDQAFGRLKLSADQIVIVTDIGCSGLFDTFFNVHALHGTHGRALTYAAGIKLANPGLKVIVTMGDGGLGIGGAHVLSACRRNLDLTLIILNNFNFGMTGGQYSATTPTDAVTSSGFLNQAEIPLDICAIAKSAGATYIDRCSGFDTNLSHKLANAINHSGFSIIETLGMCTGRYTKKNRLTPKTIDQMLIKMPKSPGIIEENIRPEYGEQYRKFAKQTPPVSPPIAIKKKVTIKNYLRQEVVILGSAGMRIITAGDIVGYAGLFAGLNVSVKNDYNITVLRGPSVSEIIISPQKIEYPGIKAPDVIVAISNEGVMRRKEIFKSLTKSTLILKEKNVSIPETIANTIEIDFKIFDIKKIDWALACLGIIAQKNETINSEILTYALHARLDPSHLNKTMELIEKTRLLDL